MITKRTTKKGISLAVVMVFMLSLVLPAYALAGGQNVEATGILPGVKHTGISVYEENSNGDLKDKPWNIIYGDVNGEGNITVADAIMILRQIVGLTELDDAALQRARVSGGDGLTVADAILVLRYIVGLISEFPMELIQLRMDFETVASYTMLIQIFKLEMLKTFTNDFQSGYLDEDFSDEQMERYYDLHSQLLFEAEEAEGAFERIYSDKVNELAEGFVELAGRSRPNFVARWFGSYVPGSQIQNRDEVLKGIDGMDAGEKKVVFEVLQKEFKDHPLLYEIADEEDSEKFWADFEKGYWANGAARFHQALHSDVMQKALDTYREQTDSPAERAVEVGGELCVHGAGIVVSVIPGGSTGAGFVERSITIEQMYQDRSEYIEEQYDGDAEAFVEDIAEKTYESLEGMEEETRSGMKEAAALAFRLINLTSFLDLDGEVSEENIPLDSGLILVKDESPRDERADIASALGEDNDGNEIFTVGMHYLQKGLDKIIPLLLPEGNWEVEAVNEKGETDVTETESTAGKKSEVTVNTSGKDPLDDDPGDDPGNDNGEIIGIPEDIDIPEEWECELGIDYTGLERVETNFVFYVSSKTVYFIDPEIPSYEPRRHGVYIRYYQDTDDITEIGNYYQGYKSGKFMYWSLASSSVYGQMRYLSKVEHYEQGELNGPYTGYSVAPDGTVYKESEGQYSNGSRSGTWHFYYSDGSLKNETKYD